MPRVRVGSVDELWDGDMMPCRAAGRKLLVIRLDGEVHAYEDRCAHLGLPLSDGTLEGHVLTCSAHHYQYDARSGQGINPRSVCLTRFPARVEAGEIVVDMTEEERS